MKEEGETCSHWVKEMLDKRKSLHSIKKKMDDVFYYDNGEYKPVLENRKSDQFKSYKETKRRNQEKHRCKFD